MVDQAAPEAVKLPDPNDRRYAAARAKMANLFFAIGREDSRNGYGAMADDLMCGDLMQVPTWIALGMLAEAASLPCKPGEGAGEVEANCASLLAAYLRMEIGRLMHQAEHWAENDKPLAVHHRLMKADSYFQILVLMERDIAKGWDLPFDEIRKSLERPAINPPGTYPPSRDLYRYRDPAFVAAALTPDTTQTREAEGETRDPCPRCGGCGEWDAGGGRCPVCEGTGIDPGADDDSATSEEAEGGAYLVWSNEHRAWWGKDQRGYTKVIANAGRYDRDTALTIAGTRGGGWRLNKGNPDEIAIPEADAIDQYASITAEQLNARGGA